MLIPLVIASGKRFSAMHCAWDIDRYGGYAPYADVLTAIPMQVAAGHCFPAAFLTSASWLMALGLCLYPHRRGLGWCFGLAAFVLALALGWVQQMRGAHFFSHTLWSLWASWAIIVLLHYLLGLWRSDARPATDAPAAVPACVHEPAL